MVGEFEMAWSMQSDVLHIHILFPNQWQVRPSEPRASIQFQEVAGRRLAGNSGRLRRPSGTALNPSRQQVSWIEETLLPCRI